MADYDRTTHTSTTTPTTGAATPRSDYRDPHTTTTTTTTATPRRGTSWIGTIVAVLAIVVIAAWMAGGFRGGEETAMMVGEPGVESEVIQEGAVIEGEAVPVDPAAPAAADTAPAAPAPAQQ